MIREIQPTLLLVGVPRRPHWSKVPCFYTAATLQEAIATIRLVDFDLVVIGLENSSLDVWEFLHRILGAWPQQRWILASERVGVEEEIVARSLGALMVLNALPDDKWLIDFASSLRRQAISHGPRPHVPVDAWEPLPAEPVASLKAS